MRWLSRMGSLYRQLQQLPIASAGQLKPVREPITDSGTQPRWYKRDRENTANTGVLLSPGHRGKGIHVSIPRSSTGHCRDKPVGSLDWHHRHYSRPPESITETYDVKTGTKKTQATTRQAVQVSAQVAEPVACHPSVSLQIKPKYTLTMYDSCI